MPTDSIRSSRHINIAIRALMLGTLLAALEQTVIATALPTIAGDLQDARNYPGIVTAYLVVAAVTMPLYGKLGDMYGRKAGFQAAIVAFALGSLLCGAAQNMGQLIACRALQGLGGGGLVVGAQAILADLVRPQHLARYQAQMAGVFAVASVLGPVAGGLIVEYASWRWLFLMNVPMGAMVFVMVVIAVPKTQVRGDGRVDYTGLILLSSFLATATLVASWAGSVYPWNSTLIVCLGAAGALAATLFVVAERRAVEPAVPLSLFRVNTFSISLGINVLEGFAMVGAVTFLPLFFQLGSEMSVMVSGLLLVPMVTGLLVASRIAGVAVSRTGLYRWAARWGTAIVIAGFALLSTIDSSTGLATAGAYLAVLGVGLGFAMPVVVAAAQVSVPRKDVGSATATLSVGRSIGGAFGVSVFGAVFSARVVDDIGQGMAQDRSVTLDPVMVDRLPPTLEADVRTAAGDAMVDVLHVALPFLVVAFVLTLVMRPEPIRDRAQRDESQRDVP